MPGTIATVSVRVGQSVSRGDVVATIEAMKMEAAVRVELDGQVAEILVQPAKPVEAKNLLVVLQ